MASPGDTRSLIETAVARFLEEVPALQPLKITVALELRGRGDVQMWRVALPGPEVSKRVDGGERVRLSLPRSHFNALAEKGRVADWREAFEQGVARAEGPSEILKLVANVVERQEQRARTRRARA